MKSIIHAILCAIPVLGMLLGTAMPAAAPQPAPEISWPGDDNIKIWDITLAEDVSGLDFADQKLYIVDNKESKIWVLERDALGNLAFVSGFEEGRAVRFAQNMDRKGPDTEGITVAANGLIYLAAERDEADGQDNKSSILQIDVNEKQTVLTVQQQWDLTSSLPKASVNKGIEAVEWVAFDQLADMLWDQTSGGIFDPDRYPDAVAEGVFFAALEANGHIYGYILYEDGSCIQIADIDSLLGSAMALDYDAYENILWVAMDDGGECRMAQIKLNGTAKPSITHVLPSKALDANANNEGFAIVQAELTDLGFRSVYRVTDGIREGVLKEEWIKSSF